MLPEKQSSKFLAISLEIQKHSKRNPSPLFAYRELSNKRKQHCRAYVISQILLPTMSQIISVSFKQSGTFLYSRILSGENFAPRDSKPKVISYQKIPNSKDHQSNKNFILSSNPNLQQFHSCSKRNTTIQNLQQQHSQVIKHSRLKPEPSLWLPRK